MRKKKHSYTRHIKREKDQTPTARVAQLTMQKHEQSSPERAEPGLGHFLALQQSIGNRAVQRLIQHAVVMRQGEEVKGIEAAVVAAAAKAADTRTLSGASWVSEFPTSTEVSDLDSSFSGKVQRFISALKTAGATVTISATKRPAERAYLMHWAWRIAKENYNAQKVPAKDGVNINWWHGNQADSKTAAQAMVDKYKIDKLKVAPSLTSHHIAGKAIDMSVSWSRELTIKNPKGVEILIKSSPKDHTNAALIAVGKSFQVIHFIEVDKDKVHWSVDGS